MRLTGTLTKWDDSRGFGFITPTSNSTQIFVHISAYPREGRRPCLNEFISYEPEIGTNGKLQAVRVQRFSSSTEQSKSTYRQKKSSSAHWIFFVLIAVIGISAYEFYSNELHSSVTGTSVFQENNDSETQLANAFQNHRSNLQVQGSGIVYKILSDDTEGSQHQGFILTLTNGQTLLVAHNIDLASRITDLNLGDSVEFYGEYEWNEKGGVIHWTHIDPSGRHESGWLRHNGQTYQ